MNCRITTQAGGFTAGICEPEMSWLTILFVAVAVVSILVVLWFVFIYPRWNVWASRKAGEADLAEAQFEQKIQVARAQARLDAATLNKQAAVIEAEAVGLQIDKIGKELTDHPLYLRWQWIRMMEERDNGETIYVPTEANLPILEATRRMLPSDRLG